MERSREVELLIFFAQWLANANYNDNVKIS